MSSFVDVGKAHGTIIPQTFVDDVYSMLKAEVVLLAKLAESFDSFIAQFENPPGAPVALEASKIFGSYAFDRSLDCGNLTVGVLHPDGESPGIGCDDISTKRGGQRLKIGVVNDDDWCFHNQLSFR